MPLALPPLGSPLHRLLTALGCFFLAWAVPAGLAAKSRPFLSQEHAVELFNPKAPPLKLEEFEDSGEPASEETCVCAQTEETPPAVVQVAAIFKSKSSGPKEPEILEVAPPKVLPVPKSRDGRRFKVLVLGDSLGLCGFGKSLDALLRSHRNVSAVSTYMACGTIPSSWLKIGPYSGARTACGFWSIESGSGAAPAETRDTYGMARGHKPASHLVPKIENLLEALQPDILVMQNGTNLLSLFSDGATVVPTRHDPQLRAHLTPFLQTVTDRSTSLKKIYWVAPPVSGRYSKATQDFLVEKLSSYGSGAWGVVDSRSLVNYPYRSLMPDKEHFIGRDMEIWAEGVFKTIAQDMESASIPSKNLAEQKRFEATVKTADASAARTHVMVRAKLLRKSQPLKKEQILPYQESVVSHLYEVESVERGSYAEKEILVMHPAHIRLRDQSLSEYRVGQSYSLELIELEGSPWESIKRSDTSGKLELLPFIRVEDEARYPTATR